MTINFWSRLSKQNKARKETYQAITRVMHEFCLSPWDTYGGEVLIEGFVGDTPVRLKASYSGMDSSVFSDLVSFVKRKDEAEKKASKGRK
jgi:hypothetical protein